jgi:hypothetical protein
MNRLTRLILLSGGGLFALGAALWFGRVAVAEHTLGWWLGREGVEAALKIQRIDSHGVVLGGTVDGNRITVQRLVVDWSLSGTPEVRAIAAEGMRIQASLDQKGLHLGGLDPLITKLTAQKQDTKPLPRIALRDVQLDLTTEAGVLHGTVTGGYDGTRARMVVRMHPSTITRTDARLTLKAADVTLHGGPDGVQLETVLDLPTADLPDTGLVLRNTAGVIKLSSTVPLAAWVARLSDDTPATRTAEPMILDVALTADQARLGDLRAGMLDTRITFAGTTGLSAATIKGKGAIAATGRVHIPARKMLSASGLSGQYLEVLTQALSDAHATLDATILANAGQFIITARQPVTLSAANGVRAIWTAQGPATVDRTTVKAAGGLRLSGGGGPDLALDISRLDLWRGLSGAKATLVSQWRYSGMLPDGQITGGAGTLKTRITAGPEGLRVTLDDCAPVAAQTLTMAGMPIRDLRLDLCPAANTPFVAARKDGWVVTGAARTAGLTLPKDELTLADGQLGLSLVGGAQGLQKAGVAITTVHIRDRAKVLRFYPLTLSGPAQFDGRDWTVNGALTDRFGALGTLAARQKADGSGVATVRIPALVFDPKGRTVDGTLPTLRGIVRKATGTVTGHIDASWRGPDLRSGGTFSTVGFSAEIPSGDTWMTASGIAATLEMADLMTGTSKPGQTVRIASLTGGAPLTDIDATYALTPKGVVLTQMTAPFAGGTLTLDPLTMPYVPATIQGIARISGATGTGIVALLNAQKQFALEGVFDATVPFVISPKDARINGGVFAARGPGDIRLDSDAKDAGTAGLALQALKHFRFETLDGTIAGDPAGRVELGMNFLGKAVNRVELTGALPGGRTASIENVPFKFKLTTSVDLAKLAAGANAASRPTAQFGNSGP